MADDFDDSQQGEDLPSKSQRKRDMLALRDLGEKLLAVPDERLRGLSDSNLVEAVLACKKINKGNARKRQLQYIGKLMRSADVDEIHRLAFMSPASTNSNNGANGSSPRIQAPWTTCWRHSPTSTASIFASSSATPSLNATKGGRHPSTFAGCFSI